MTKPTQSHAGTTVSRRSVKATTRAKKPKSGTNGVRAGDGWQAEKSALTRRAILEGAVRCFVRDGYTKTTTAMIAAEAGVSRGAMMHHFSARSEVMKAVIAHLHELRLEEYRQLMGDIELSEEINRADVRRSVQAAWAYHNLPSFVAYQELQSAARTDEELGEVIGSFEKEFEKQFLRTAKSVFPQWRSVKSFQAAHDLVHFVMHGMATTHRSSNRKKRAEHIIDLVTDQLVEIYKLEA
ncbi:MAG: TetR/AcrR family transcriptional regulator [Luminiphilus sp.]|nr:TetR/AcrR family transcriptional regulator [Luminiphilus sp.]